MAHFNERESSGKLLGNIGPQGGDSEEAELRRYSSYNFFWTLHLVGAFILMAVAGCGFGFGGAGSLNQKVYVTVSTLEKNQGSGNNFITKFNVISSPHLWWFAFIPMWTALFHLIMVIPAGLANGLYYYLCLDDEGRKVMKVKREEDTLIVGHKRKDVNIFYYAWFAENLMFGASGIKHAAYGPASAVFVVLVGMLVGVTDIFTLIGISLFNLLGSLSLWNMEYMHGEAAHKRAELEREAAGPTSSGTERVDGGSLYEGRSFVDESFGSLRKKVFLVSGPLVPLLLSVISLLTPFTIILGYYFTMISENSHEIKWYVHFAVVYYIAYFCLVVGLLITFHFNVNFAGDYLMIEGIIQIVSILAFAGVISTVIFADHDHSYMYGIEVPA